MENDLFDRGTRKTKLANADKLAARRKRRGNTGKVNLLTTPNLMALLLLLTGIIAASASLFLDQAPSDAREEYVLGDYLAAPASSTTSTSTTRSTSTTAYACTACPDGTACGQVNGYGETCRCSLECVPSEGCKNTCSLAGVIAAKEEQAAHATTTSTSSTTTTTAACGADMQLPCMRGSEGCNEDTVLGSDNICHAPTCMPSVESGMKGCGAFALEFCRPGHPYKYVKNLEGRVDSSESDSENEE